MTRPKLAPVRSFDPVQVGACECQAWVAYYRKEWVELLFVSVRSVRAGFRMSWPRTLRGAWLALRAIQRWAPYPAANDPDGARRYIERFYRLVAAESGEQLDTVEAARLEVEWWRLHRELQRGDGTRRDEQREALAGALAALYAFLYDGDPADVREAARLRAEAMDISDRWVAEGCRMDSPLIPEERALLVRSYAALLAAVHR